MEQNQQDACKKLTTREEIEIYRENGRAKRPDSCIGCSIVWIKIVSQCPDGKGEAGQITTTEKSKKGTAEVER